MSDAVAGVLLLSVAGWILAPDPHHLVRRLEPAASSPGTKVARLVHGREGAPPLNARLLAGLTVGVIAFTFLPGLTGQLMLVAVPAMAVVGGGRLSRDRRRYDVVHEELADTVELLAVCLSAGATMSRALEVVGSVQTVGTAVVLSKVSGLLAMGVPEPQAWQELTEDEVWGAVARDVARSARSGTSLVEVLHTHAEEARLDAQERALKRARTAGVRSVVPLMACFLPAFVLVGVLPIVAGLLGGLLSP